MFDIVVAVLQLMAIVLLVKLIEKPGWAIKVGLKVVGAVLLFVVGLVGIAGLIKWYKASWEHWRRRKYVEPDETKFS